MSEFRPDLSTTLTIGSRTYGFVPHPIIADEVHKIPREQTTTYQLIDLADSTLWALKVVNVGYRDRQCVQSARTTAALTQYRNLPGLFAAHRSCLTKQHYPALIASYPELECAILMPWIHGKTWAGFMADPLASATYSRLQAQELALTMAQVLWNLEAHHLAHTDIAGDNVMILSFHQVELIDIEGLYMPEGPLPARYSRGWQGYQHPHLDHRGNYRPDGDRFAGAMLLTEMLTWWNSLVRASTPDECDAIFQIQGQEPAERLEQRRKAVRSTLRSISPVLRDLFDAAWSSPDLSQCPDFASWTMCLLQVQN